MQTFFKDGVERDPATQRSEAIFRSCVHCGLCTGTCPTYQLLGDELDSPGGGFTIKDMLENDRKPTKDVVEHLDRCLSCLACTTTCPSGVDYMHLIDHGRQVIERDYQRPLPGDLSQLSGARVTAPGPAGCCGWRRWGHGCARCCPRRSRPRSRSAPTVSRLRPGPTGPACMRQRRCTLKARGRIALFPGCARRVLEPEISASTIRLYRAGLRSRGAGGFVLRGADPPHGQGHAGRSHRPQMIGTVLNAHDRAPLDALVITASGCGTTVKDYGAMFQDHPAMKARAEQVAGLAQDITELVTPADLEAASTGTPCSMGCR